MDNADDHIKVLTVTHRYPTRLRPFHHNFIRQRVRLLTEEPGLTIRVASITPFSLPFTEKWNRYHAELLDKDIAERVNYLSFPGKRFPRLIRSHLSVKLARYLSTYNASILHMHWAYPSGISIPNLKRKGFKTVLTIHGSDLYDNLNNPAVAPLVEESIAETDRILVSGPPLKEEIERRFLELSDKTEVVYNIVDPDTFPLKNNKRQNKARKLLRWNDQKIHALTVADLKRAKGVDTLIHAAGQLSNKYHFHVIGKKPNNSYAAYLQQLVRDHSLHNLTFHPPVAHEELCSYYHAADVYVHSSRREGFGLAMVEAAMTGLPIIATETGIAPLITEITGGPLIPPDDSNALAAKLTTDLDYHSTNPGEIRKTLIKKFGPNAYKQRILKIYESL